MPFELPLPTRVKRQGWKVKVQDKERVEEPHVTIIFKTQRWRFRLRTLDFYDMWPDPKDVPHDVLDAILQGHVNLCREWDRRYPLNPVAGFKSEGGKDE